MEKQTWNVCQLSAAFFLIFFAFMSSSFIEETVIATLSEEGNVGQHAGYNSLAIIYAFFTVCNFLAPPVIQILGPKWALVAASLTYALFEVGFLFLNEPYLYISSALLGLGAAIIWTAQGAYLSLNSTKETAALHSGIFWACAQGCLSFGGVFLVAVFKWGPEKINDSMIHLLYGVFSALSIGGSLILAFLRMPKSVESEEKEKLSQLELFKSSLRLCATRPIALLMVTSAYSGIELSFLTGIYPSCIGFTKQLGTNTRMIVGLNAISQGLGQITGGFLFGILGSKTARFGRDRIVIFGTVVFLLVFLGVFLTFPSSAPLHPNNDSGVFQPQVWVVLLCGYWLGVGDSSLNTQIFSFLICRYPKQIAQAFSLNKFFQHLLTCAAFVYGARLSLEVQLIMLVVGAIIGCICFCLAERCALAQEAKSESKNEIVAQVD